jgi:peptidoglycan-associated lipoprotein
VIHLGDYNVNRILIPVLIALILTACSSSGPVASIEDRNQPAKKAGVGQGAGAGQGATSGTSSSGTAADKGVETTALPPGGVSGGGVDGQALEGSASNKNADPRKDPASPLSKRSIYFDYDSNVVKDDYRPVVEAHAAYIVSHKESKIVLQGNTDNRGSREYNLALGQRRAEAVRKALSVLGAGDAQMEAVSFGEEKPRAVGDTEQDYAENRRVDIIYNDE